MVTAKKVVFVGNTGFSLYGFRLNLMLHLVAKGWEVIAVADDEEDFRSQFGSQGIKFIDIVVDHKGFNACKDIRYMVELLKIYRREAPDVVHHFTIKPVIFGTIAAKLAHIANIVNTITGLGYTFEKGGWLRNLVETLYRLALSGRPRVIFQNRDNRDLFLSKRLVSRKQASVILGSGIDTLHIRPSNGTAKKARGLRFILVGRMLWSKGVGEFVRAAAMVKKRFSNCKFIMVGGHSGAGAVGNPDRISLKWLENEQNHGAVQWLGRLSNMQVLQCLDECDVVVLPSFYGEGVPKSLLEAAAKAKPIITTDHPGCREVVADGCNGYLVPVRNSDKLAECMISIIETPEVLQRMGAESRKRAENIFDDRIVIQQILRIYGN